MTGEKRLKVGRWRVGVKLDNRSGAFFARTSMRCGCWRVWCGSLFIGRHCASLPLHPVIRICRFGWKTPTPQVCVSVISRNGGQTVYSGLDNEQGNAAMQLYAEGLGHITGMRVIDERGNVDEEKRND